MSDLLNMEKINSLGPIMGELSSGVYDIESVCVETGLCRVNVCGLVQLNYWRDFYRILDWDENEYETDSFYLDEES